MLSVSNDFITAANSQTRRLDSYVVVNFTDVLLDPTVAAESLSIIRGTESGDTRVTEDSDIRVIENSSNPYSRFDQVANGNKTTTFKNMTLDGLSTLDGTYSLAPGDDAGSLVSELGWWSYYLSDGVTGETLNDTGLRLTFGSRKINSVCVVGDTKWLQYPVDFTIEFYSGTSLVNTETIIANTEVTLEIAIAPVLDSVDSAELRITKWSQVGAAPKITEFSTAYSIQFDSDEIESWSITEQREITNNNSIPIGNIASNELSISFVNKDRNFDANNSTSPYFGLLKPNVRIEVFVGFWTGAIFEYIPMFTGWSKGWNVPDNSITASTTARDRLSLLAQTNYSTSFVLKDQDLFSWFQGVMLSGGIAPPFFNVDERFKEPKYIIPIGWLENVKHRSALETLATAAATSVYSDRTGVVQIKPSDSLLDGGSTSSAVYGRDTYSDKDNQPVYESIVNSIAVTTQPLIEVTGQTVYETSPNEPETIAGSSTETFTIFYSETPVSDGVPTIDPIVSGLVIDTYNLYSWGGDITVSNSGTTSKDFTFKITGDTYTVQGKQTRKSENIESQELYGKNSFSFPVNTFLQNVNLAEFIAVVLQRSFSDPQRDLTVTFEPGGNPALELGDRITITDRYTSKEYYIVYMDINYNGGLNMAMKGRILQSLSDSRITENGDIRITEDGDTRLSEL